MTLMERIASLTYLYYTDPHAHLQQSLAPTVPSSSSVTTNSYVPGPSYTPMASISSGFCNPNIALSSPIPQRAGHPSSSSSPPNELRLVESYTGWAFSRPGVPQCSAKCREAFSSQKFLTTLKSFVSNIDLLAFDLAFRISAFDERRRDSDHLSLPSWYHGRKRRCATLAAAENHGVTPSIFGPDTGMFVNSDHDHQAMRQMPVTDTCQRFQ